MKSIAIGCDPNAEELKQYLMEFIRGLGYPVDDLGSDDPIYAHTAINLAEKVAAKEYDRGILLCGTGIGMSIAANKVKGAYAALASDDYSAERAVLSNNSNILCIGAFTVGRELAKRMIKTWLSVEFDSDSRSADKVKAYMEYDRKKVF